MPKFNSNDENDNDEEKDNHVSQISKELINQLKDSSSELLMTFPLEEDTEQEDNQIKNEITEHIRKFKFKPKDIKNYLDRFIISQDEAKKALSIAICDHYNVIKDSLNSPANQKQHYAKQNILMILVFLKYSLIPIIPG